MKLQHRSLKNYNNLNCSLITRINSFLNFHPLKGDLCICAFFLLLLNFFLFLMQILYSVIL